MPWHSWKKDTEIQMAKRSKNLKSKSSVSPKQRNKRQEAISEDLKQPKLKIKQTLTEHECIYLKERKFNTQQTTLLYFIFYIEIHESLIVIILRTFYFL